MAVEQSLTFQLRQSEVFCLPFQKFAEQQSLARQFLREIIIGEEVHQFVAENGGATGLKHNDRNVRFDFCLEGCERLPQQSLGAVQHAEVIERAAAAQSSSRKSDVESGRFQNLDRGFGGVGRK